jgi:hypothetical protein
VCSSDGAPLIHEAGTDERAALPRTCYVNFGPLWATDSDQPHVAFKLPDEPGCFAELISPLVCPLPTIGLFVVYT